MPSSPKTPRHSRRTSKNDLSFATPLTNGNGSDSRRHSKSSLYSPTTPKRQSFHRSGSSGQDPFGSSGAAPSNGLGSLADELADAWGEDEDDEEPDMNFQEAGQEEEEGDEEREGDVVRENGMDVSSSRAHQEAPKPASLAAPSSGRHHQRRPSDYDGSDYGGSSDMDSPGMPPGLVSRMDMVESLARRGTESTGGEQDNVVKRVVDGLKDLGGQSGVEGGATRLITAHSALSSHLLHQTRLLQSLAYPVFAPLSVPPDEEFVDDLMPLLVTLGESMPRPTTAAFNSLDQLHGLTTDLIQTLNYLSDTLHMSRQTTTTATRRLRSARELVAEMRKEEDAREEGERWLKRGNWSERLSARECAGVCGDVVGGFEEVCNGWRARLVAQAEAVGA